MKTKKNEYQFGVTQIMVNCGTIYIEARTFEEAESKLKKVKQSSVDWYTDDYSEQIENSKLKFNLEAIREIK